MIRGYFQSCNIKMSIETIEGTMDHIKKMVVGKRGNMRGSSAIQMYDRSKIRVHKDLFLDVLIPEEEGKYFTLDILLRAQTDTRAIEMYKYLQEMGSARRVNSPEGSTFEDEKCWRVKTTVLQGLYTSQTKIQNSRVTVGKIGEIIKFVTNPGVFSRNVPKHRAHIDGDYYYFSDSYFLL